MEDKMGDAIATPKQQFTLAHSKDNVEEKIKYICDEMPLYKFISKNESLNSIRVEATRAFQPQHLDFRFQESDSESATFELEISKHTGGMTNDDSNLFAKENMDEFMDYLSRCLDGYKITDEDKKKQQSAQNKNMVLYFVVGILLLWFFFFGGMELIFGL